MTQVLRQGSPLPSDFGLNGVLRQTLVRLLLCVLMAAGLLSLVGCAGGVAATSITAEPVTESDEPDARKRARLRLELASGYFEQGQTTVALDEIKQ
ncbi:MAG: hypothetical protein U1E02_40725, partial [Hydrogenophaga sp.]|nr:hypothetical protein [Hydrogenophaga sp.]